MSAHKKGFTLVELLVVISIIAILSVIGITVFTGIQKNARDTRRRADIQAIEKTLEVHHNDTANKNCTAPGDTYCPIQNDWFASGTLPTDPQQNGTNHSYCMWSNNISGSSIADPAAWGNNTCPVNFEPLVVGLPVSANNAAWKICASLENGTVFCRRGAQ